MERVTIAGAATTDLESGVDARMLTGSLGTTDVAINHYRIRPGEGFPGGLHAHLDQEEVFVVLEGEATFQTLEETVTVEANEAIRFGPGEFQTGRSEAEGDLVAIAIGAPRDTDETRVPVACPDCGHDDLRPAATDGDGDSNANVELACPACGAVHVPRGCPECGRHEMTVVPGDDRRTIVVCPDCGVELDRPRFADR